MLKRAVLKIIQLYQKVFSPLLGQNCRFYPSCSEYCRQSIEKYGAARGSLAGLKRLFKCHPFNKGGIDLPQ